MRSYEEKQETLFSQRSPSVTQIQAATSENQDFGNTQQFERYLNEEESKKRSSDNPVSNSIT